MQFDAFAEAAFNTGHMAPPRILMACFAISLSW
jgi:hypothetical protein